MKSSGDPGGGALVLGCGASQRQRSPPLHLDQGGQSCWSRSSLGCESPSAALEPPEHTDVFQQPRILGAWPAVPCGQYLQRLNATLTAVIKFLSKGRLELRRARQAPGDRETQWQAPSKLLYFIWKMSFAKTSCWSNTVPIIWKPGHREVGPKRVMAILFLPFGSWDDWMWHFRERKQGGKVMRVKSSSPGLF